MDSLAILEECGITWLNSGVFTTRFQAASLRQKTLVSYNPATERPLATINPASSKQVEDVISTAHQTFETWSQLPAPKRGEVVRQIGEMLRKHKDRLGSLIALEMGKIKSEGEGEVQEMIDMADFAAGQSRMLYGLTMQSERFQHRMMEQWHPLGVVSVITAFNFPMAVWAWNAFLAAIAGNTVIWKPSSETPLCAIAVQKICEAVMKRNNCLGVFTLMVTKDKKNAKCLLEDRRIRLVSFTGSSKVGYEVNQTVSKRLARCLLECSGNNAIILDKTADLSIAIPAIVFGSVGTAGQRCTTTRRLIIHEGIYQKVIRLLMKAYRQVRIGDPLDAKNLMGPLINASAVNAYKSALLSIKKAGGKILIGGKVLSRKGYFVEPVIALAQNHWDIVQQETFVPILYVMKFKTFHEAIEWQNDVPQGLSSALFTRDLIQMEQYLSCKGSDCGIANINIGTSGAEIGGAFGGEKETGGGREAGSDAWKNYMRRQTNTINWSKELPLAQGIQFHVNR